ncbi:MAG TPA: hypothetical protein DCZ91_26010, partial [Lachnospiraceae bacterium]|nr:hypothetical protein [Lachnospiraceae bacterium]
RKENRIKSGNRKALMEEPKYPEKEAAAEANPAEGLPEELQAVYRAIDFYPKTAEEIGQALPEQYRGQMVPYLMRLCMEELILQVSPGHFCRKGEK